MQEFEHRDLGLPSDGLGGMWSSKLSGSSLAVGKEALEVVDILLSAIRHGLQLLDK